MIRTRRAASALIAIFAVLLTAGTAFGQGTTFTYQGRLTDGGTPPNGTYDFQFKLYNADGAQQGLTLTRDEVLVTNGVFAVQLDFGNPFDGTMRLLEIAVRPGSGVGSDPYTTLAPRQEITSTPYAIRSLTAGSADQLSPACLGCVTDGQIDSVSGSKVTGTVANATNATTANNVSGIVGVTNGGTGLTSADASGNFLKSDGAGWTSAPLLASDVPNLSASYVKNTTSQQASSNFNVSGDGTVGLTLSGNVVNSSTRYNIGGQRVLGLSGHSMIAPNSSTFVGVGAGQFSMPNDMGINNSFFGRDAGYTNASGMNNSFFGRDAGKANSNGTSNAFFGYLTGMANTSGGNNAFFGSNAGRSNTLGMFNTFVGNGAGGSNIGGLSNVFFGSGAGSGNTEGDDNTFLGRGSGPHNIIGNQITLIGAGSDVGEDNLVNATAIGAGTVVSASNTVVLGTNTVTVQVPGNLSIGGTLNGVFPNFISNTTTTQTDANFNISGNGTAGGTLSGNLVNATTQYNIGGNRVLSVSGDVADPNSNTFAGVSAGLSNPSGSHNSFFGKNAGQLNTTGGGNSFFGVGSGNFNTDGSLNSFFGKDAGASNTEGHQNAFFGVSAGRSNTVGSSNSFFGVLAGMSNRGARNSYFGHRAGESHSDGDNNAFFGSEAGRDADGGENNSFFGANAGRRTVSSGNAFFGTNAGESTHSGEGNAFFGAFAGFDNGIGFNNSFFGRRAGFNGNGNRLTIIGADANVVPGNDINNATAIGANAFISQNNSLVLGSINGVNGAAADTDVGIGTTTPKSRLHVASGYVQLPVISGAPPPADCGADDKAGRMVVDPAGARLYVCTGTAGWKAAALVP